MSTDHDRGQASRGTLKLLKGGSAAPDRPSRRRAAVRRTPRDPIEDLLEHLDEEPASESVDDAVAEPVGDPVAEPAIGPSRTVRHRSATERRTAESRPARVRPARKQRPARRRRLHRPTWTTVLLAVALCAAVGVAVFMGTRWYGDRALDDAHQQAVAAARQTTVNFVSVSASSVDRDLQRILAGATGDFKDEFTRGQAQVRAAIVENNVESRGSVLRAALVSGDRRGAVVLVAIDATVKNSKTPDGRASHYRIQVDVARDGASGRWLVSRLQFVG